MLLFHSTSITAAAPIPVAAHMDTTPYLPLIRFNSGISVAIYREPVLPKGCPSAIAPPFRFNFLESIPSYYAQ